MRFKIIKKSKKSKARVGKIETEHGVLQTPAFFPVATKACLKTLDTTDIENLGFEGVLCNTYHLMLKPGSKVIKKMGGLHKFINFKGVIATDSGGFQVFSLGQGLEQNVGKFATQTKPTTKSITNLADRRNLLCLPKKSKTLFSLAKIREEGVWFRSHIDGSEQFLSPEKSMQIQQDLGADIIFAFDQPSSPLDNLAETKQAMERTHRWAERCIAQQIRSTKSEIRNKSKIQNKKILKQALFGIVQGGKYKKLRHESAKFIANLDFDGFGIGGSFGESYGDSKKGLKDALAWTIPLLPKEKPCHFLGIGHLDDIVLAVKAGVDSFDCVHPTRMARHGVAFIKQGQLDFTKAELLNDKKPIDKTCLCQTCQNYTRAYICHLFRAKEITAMRLLTLHNLWFFKQFFDKIRKEIEMGKF